MLFNSFEFLLFFPLVTILFFSIPHKYRWLLLLSASCFFYMFFIPVYILILFFTIIIDYFAGIWIERENNHKKRKVLLSLSLVANIGVLAIFKYYNFFIGNVNHVLESFNISGAIPFLEIILPIGLSFHTFQAMSYTIEVYRGNQTAEKHFGIYALYVMFYPQLVAGPIERPQNILHQFHEKHEVNFENIRSGLKIILWGLFKKCVVADRLAIPVDNVFNNPAGWSPIAIILATIFFSIQIYCDFSGYSDIAIGSARAMGFRLMKNFDHPYFSKSISDFWNKWHISLSTWFRDYLYIPLGGNRKGFFRTNLNLFIVFLISGIWHGANWTFVIWGAIHGSFLMVSNLLNRKFTQKSIWKTIQPALTLILVCLAWIYFRAANLETANLFISKIFSPSSDYFNITTAGIHGLAATYLGLPLWKLVLTCILAFAFMVLDFLIYKQAPARLENYPTIIRWSLYAVFIIAIIFTGVFNTNQFIYFQF